MNTSLTSLKRLSLSLTLALATVVALAVLLNAVSAQSATSSVLHAPASEPPQDPPPCLIDFVIALDRSGSMQEETRCYGCWVQAGDYPSGTTYPLPFLDHCDPSDPLEYQGYRYVSIEAEHYSRYLIEADSHRE